MTSDQKTGMLQTMAFIPANNCPALILNRCGLWLAGLAGQQDNWDEAGKWTGLYLKKSPSPLLLFVHLLCKRMDFQPMVAGCFFLVSAWFCSCTPSLYPALRGACQRKPEKIKKILQTLAPGQADHQTALELLLQVEASSQLRASRRVLHGLAGYFEEVLAAQQAAANSDDTADSRIRQQALAAVEQTLSETLSSWNDSAKGEVPVGRQSLLIHDSGTDSGDQLESLTYNIKALLHRYEGDHYLETRLEWQEWAGIMVLYQQCARSETGHFEAYCAAQPVCWNWAAWLWNSYNNVVLATAVFRWLRHEALLLEDYDTVAAMEENLR
jgi:hypothetical protein